MVKEQCPENKKRMSKTNNCLADIVVDSIYCEPARHDKYGNIVPGQFDTAVIDHKDGEKTGVKGRY
jgi:hypothetical protein